MFSVLFSNIYVGIVVVVFFGITIFIHELGHYLTARWCGLQIKVFSIGFGPAIWKRTINGILYKVGCIPFGGYVALPQLDPTAMQTVQGGADGDTPSTGEVPLPPVAPWKKIVVSLAGATGNVLLALLLAWIVYWVGMPATTASQDTVLGYVDTDSALYEQGVRMGDRVVRVNGTAVDQWSHFIQESAMYDIVDLDIEKADGSALSVRVPTEPWRYGIRMVGGVEARGPVTVGAAEPGMSAAAAGVESGDVIVSFGGEAVLSRAHLIEQVAASRGQTCDMVVQRRVEGISREVTLHVTPAYDEKHKMTRIGIQFRLSEQRLDTSAKVYPRPMTQIRHHASAIVRFLRDLATPEKSARAANMVGGPVAIITSYVDMIRASFMLAVWFTGFLNINLAIINLLPVPVLDGGHIVFSLWEWIFRRPIHAKVVNVMVNIFAVLIIGLFLMLSCRDVDRYTPAGRLIRGWVEKAPPPATVDALEAVEADRPGAAEVDAE